MKGKNLNKIKIKESTEKYILTDLPLFSHTFLKRPLQGHIFACTKKSEGEYLQKMLFATNKIYEDKVYNVKKGDILFFTQIDTNKIQGPFIALLKDNRDMRERKDPRYDSLLEESAERALEAITGEKLGVDPEKWWQENKTKIIFNGR